MSDKFEGNQFSEDTPEKLIADKKTVEVGVSGVSRRGITKAAVIAPIAMVALSRPAWGGDMVCGFSGMVSGFTSLSPGNTACFSGQNVRDLSASNNAVWKDVSSVVLNGIGPKKLGDFTFGQLGINITGFHVNRAFKKVLGWNKATADEQVFLAAIINSVITMDYAFESADIISVGQQLATTGSATISGLNYSLADIINFIEYSFTPL